MRRVNLAFLCYLLLILPAHALTLEKTLPDPAQEARAQALFKQIRCVVCTSESIHDSNADLAKDLRLLIRERITAGDSDEAVIRYLSDRYGDAILMEPRVAEETYLLWYGPLIVLILGGVVMVVSIRKRRG